MSQRSWKWKESLIKDRQFKKETRVLARFLDELAKLVYLKSQGSYQAVGFMEGYKPIKWDTATKGVYDQKWLAKSPNPKPQPLKT